MYKILTTTLFFLIFTVNSAYADETTQRNAIPYHCPNVNEIKYTDIAAVSQTNINNFTIPWYAMHRKSDDYSPIVKFIDVSLNDDGGYKHSYTVECRYITNTNNFITFDIQQGVYKASGIIGSNWKGSEKFVTCESNNPENCAFLMSNENIIKTAVYDVINANKAFIQHG